MTSRMCRNAVQYSIADNYWTLSSLLILHHGRTFVSLPEKGIEDSRAQSRLEPVSSVKSQVKAGPANPACATEGNSGPATSDSAALSDN